MNQLQTNELLEKTILLFKKVRNSTMEAAASLYEVHESKAWEGRYSSFSEFVQDGAGISQSFGSKLLKVYKYYIIDSNIRSESLEGADSEKLYLATNLIGTPEEQIEKAQTLTRQEIQSELAVDKEGNEHVCEMIMICKTCGRRMS